MTTTKIDYNHPLFIGPSDTSGSVIISVKLTGSDNYGIWNKSMRIALLGKRKYGFVTGVCSKDTYKEEWQEQQETCNAIVLSWLMNTVADELLGGIVYAASAHKVWEDLKERFDKVNRIRIYQLHRGITTLAQGPNSISTYFSKLKILWDEYDALVPSPSCECLKSKDYVDHLYQLRLIQFLSGLNDSYNQARRQILLKSVSPTINQAYAMIIEDEIQHSAYLATARRQILLKSVSPTINQAYAMIIEDEIQHSAYLATVNNKIDPVIMQSSQNQTYAQGNQNFRGRRLQCEYCHLNGHTKDNCYKLIGYPTDWKHKEKNDYGNGSYRGTRSHQAYGHMGGHKGPAVNNGQQSFTSANNVTWKHNDPGDIASSSHKVNNAFVAKVHCFTENEYKQIMGLLNKDTKETHGNTTCIPVLLHV
ncbi:hypothetical protein AABB24_035585 [Solanum stoloniferum]|uniref:Retrotransposon Copia-like N-terminal domain-containing protein n=1 Tax=Solanum stoloniferum TaxID=62892 RepID=A0ABD2RAR8_9SOLN